MPKNRVLAKYPGPSQQEGNQRLSRSVIWVAIIIAFMMANFTIPTLGPIFADMLSCKQLPTSTRIVISAGPTVLMALAVAGAALLVMTRFRQQAMWLQGALVIGLSVALGFTVVALFTPIMRLLEQAAP